MRTRKGPSLDSKPSQTEELLVVSATEWFKHTGGKQLRKGEADTFQISCATESRRKDSLAAQFHVPQNPFEHSLREQFEIEMLIKEIKASIKNRCPDDFKKGVDKLLAKQLENSARLKTSRIAFRQARESIQEQDISLAIESFRTISTLSLAQARLRQATKFFKDTFSTIIRHSDFGKRGEDTLIMQTLNTRGPEEHKHIISAQEIADSTFSLRSRVLHLLSQIKRPE